MPVANTMKYNYILTRIAKIEKMIVSSISKDAVTTSYQLFIGI